MEQLRYRVRRVKERGRTNHTTVDIPVGSPVVKNLIKIGRRDRAENRSSRPSRPARISVLLGSVTDGYLRMRIRGVIFVTLLKLLTGVHFPH